MINQKFKIYVINIDSRLDKFANMKSFLDKTGFTFERVSAMTPHNYKFSNTIFKPPVTVQANWNSHISVYSKLLESNDEFCLVLEDDCDFFRNSTKLLNSINNLKSFEFDILQIGFISSKKGITKNRISLAKKKVYFLKKFYKLVNFIIFFTVPKKFNSYSLRNINETNFRLAQSRSLKLKHLVVSEFLNGTHAYLIHRKMAIKILNYNKNITMGADLALQILSFSGNWRIYRTPISFIGQKNYAVDIGDHHLMPNDLARLVLNIGAK